LYYLSRLQQAGKIWNELIIELTQSFKHGQVDSADGLAAAFANRAGILADAGGLNESLEELTAAIDMFKKVARRTPTALPANTVRALMRRAGIRADLGQCSAALDDLREADALCAERVQSQQLAEANELTARIAHTKATVLFDCGKEKEALTEVTRAVDMQEQIIRNSAYLFLQDDLASSYLTRGSILSALGQEDAAIADLTKSVRITQPLVAQKARTDLGLPLAMALRNRAVIMIAQSKFRLAGDDLTAAEKLLKGLTRDGNRPDLTAELAIVWTTLAQLATEVAQQSKEGNELLAKADHLYSESIKLFEFLRKHVARAQYKQLHAAALGGRGLVRYRLNRREDASKDLEAAIQLLKELDARTSTVDVRLQLALSLANRGVILLKGGDSKGALAEVDAAISMQRQLVADGNVLAKIPLASSLQLRGTIYAKIARKEQALRDLDESITLCRSLRDRDAPSVIKGLLSRSTRYRQAVATELLQS
jgi:tetratricopeptide (TPR) repeat protein